MARSLGRSLLLLGILILTGGCGGGPRRYDVSGTVTYEGQSVERGEVSFVPQDPTESPDGGTIENGRFQFSSTPGSKVVQIRGSRPLPPEKQDNPEMGLLYEDFIPACYNRESTLTAEVGPDGETSFTFDLTAPSPDR